MNDARFDETITAWMTDDRSVPSSWVLESVLEHAHRHPNRRWWQRVLDDLRPGRTGVRVTGRSGRRAVAVPMLAVVLALLLLVVGLVASGPTTPLPSPATGPAAGSLWRTTSPEVAGLVLLHADGTAVMLLETFPRSLRIGVWRPTAERTLTTLLVGENADPVRRQEAGVSRTSAEWRLDAASETATVSWTRTLRPVDGPEAVVATGSAMYRRMHLGALPPEARFPLPDESPGPPVLGAMASGGAGSVSAINASDQCTAYEPAEYLALHGDGTQMYAGALGGDGLGMWTWTGPNTRALSGWFGAALLTSGTEWVGQAIGTQQLLVQTGTSERFDDRFLAGPRAVEVREGPAPTPGGGWPATGSVWLQQTEDGVAVIAFLADGTLVARDPRYGTGIGNWQPVDADTTLSAIRYSTRIGQDHRIWAESTVDPDGATLSIRAEHQDKSADPVVDVETVTAVRLTLGS